MHYADYKTVMSPKGVMNLYRGCTHGCIYCDSRSRCYEIDHDFEDVEIKRDAPRILESQLERRRKRCMIGTGGMCDPYMHIEEELGVTRQCLGIIEKYGYGVAIITKSDRILRDIDLLKAINEKARCVVQVTMTTYDDALCKKLEPDVSSTSERFRVLMKMKENGIPTVVWLCPILPFINDTEENLRGLLDYCVRAGVRGITNFGFGMTLREGNREYYYQKLDELFPGMRKRYERTFGDSYECNSPNNVQLTEILRTECEKHGILHRAEDVFPYVYELKQKTKQTSLF